MIAVEARQAKGMRSGSKWDSIKGCCGEFPLPEARKLLRKNRFFSENSGIAKKNLVLWLLVAIHLTAVTNRDQRQRNGKTCFQPPNHQNGEKREEREGKIREMKRASEGEGKKQGKKHRVKVPPSAINWSASGCIL